MSKYVQSKIRVFNSCPKLIVGKLSTRLEKRAEISRTDA